MSQQRAHAAKVICKLGCMSKGMESRSREGVLPTYSALVGLHLKYCVQLGLPQYQKKSLICWSESSSMQQE